MYYFKKIREEKKKSLLSKTPLPLPLFNNPLNLRF